MKITRSGACRTGYLKWKGDFGYPLDYGYFENNIYMELGDGTNDPGGDGNHQNDNEEAYPYRAGWKFEHILANGLNNGTIIRGNGNVRLIDAGDTEIIPADDDFGELRGLQRRHQRGQSGT